MDEWIEWKGGECPVSPDVVVEVEFETMARYTATASEWSWEHEDDGANIVAYRISKDEGK